MIRFLACAALAAAVPSLASSGAAADAPPANPHFNTSWRTQASDGAPGRRTVAKAQYVLQARLLPTGLIRLTSDAIATRTGRVAAAAGTQLFALAGRDVEAWCAVRPRGRAPGASPLDGNARDGELCFADTNRDGRLDSHFRISSRTRGVPSFMGIVDVARFPISGGAFERLAPERFEARYFAGIRYEGLRRGQPSFMVAFGDERETGRLPHPIHPSAQDRTVRALSAEFSVRVQAGDRIEVDVRRGIPSAFFLLARVPTF